MTGLIIALDTPHQSTMLHLVEQLDPSVCVLKIGHECFTSLGPSGVRLLIDRGFRVFLDLKFHDIPNTVAQACRAAADLGVWMMNVHALGGLAMMQAARLALDDYGTTRPKLIAVTILTSLNETDLLPIGVKISLTDEVLLLARLADQAGLDGVVCAATDVMMIKAACGDSFLAVTPGIRLLDDAKHDQQRVVTPSMAVELGSDYVVVGRSITQATSPLQRVASILKALS